MPERWSDKGSAATAKTSTDVETMELDGTAEVAGETDAVGTEVIGTEVDSSEEVTAEVDVAVLVGAEVVISEVVISAVVASELVGEVVGAAVCLLDSALVLVALVPNPK